MIALALIALLASQAVETFVEIAGPLKGTQLSPAAGARAPAALILPGSGPTDRDGNNPLGVKGSTYRLLAEGLASEGVTTVRMDKRGQFASGGAAADGNRVFIADLAADANAWAADLKMRTSAPCIWLIGHSEGSLVAEVAAQTGKDICGLVLVSAPGERLSETLRAQLKANPANAPLLPSALAAVDALEAGKDVDVTPMHPALQRLFAPQVQPFLKAIFTYDPAALVKTYEGPVLIAQGTTDLQVSIADAQKLKAAKPDATLVTFEGVNHMLKVAPADRAANAATYADPSLPLAPGVAKTIADFIKSH